MMILKIFFPTKWLLKLAIAVSWKYFDTPGVSKGNLIAAVTSTECHVVLQGRKYKVGLCIIELTHGVPLALFGYPYSFVWSIEMYEILINWRKTLNQNLY